MCHTIFYQCHNYYFYDVFVAIKVKYITTFLKNRISYVISTTHYKKTLLKYLLFLKMLLYHISLFLLTVYYEILILFRS